MRLAHALLLRFGPDAWVTCLSGAAVSPHLPELRVPRPSLPNRSQASALCWHNESLTTRDDNGGLGLGRYWFPPRTKTYSVAPVPPGPPLGRASSDFKR